MGENIHRSLMFTNHQYVQEHSVLHFLWRILRGIRSTDYHFRRIRILRGIWGLLRLVHSRLGKELRVTRRFWWWSTSLLGFQLKIFHKNYKNSKITIHLIDLKPINRFTNVVFRSTLIKSIRIVHTVHW